MPLHLGWPAAACWTPAPYTTPGTNAEGGRRRREGGRRGGGEGGARGGPISGSSFQTLTSQSRSRKCRSDLLYVYSIVVYQITSNFASRRCWRLAGRGSWIRESTRFVEANKSETEMCAGICELATQPCKCPLSLSTLRPYSTGLTFPRHYQSVKTTQKDYDVQEICAAV